MRVLLVIPGLVLLAAGILCLLGAVSYSFDTETAEPGSAATTVNEQHPVPQWVGALGCVAGFGLIIYGAGRRRF